MFYNNSFTLPPIDLIHKTKALTKLPDTRKRAIWTVY